MRKRGRGGQEEFNEVGKVGWEGIAGGRRILKKGVGRERTYIETKYCQLSNSDR